MYSSGDDLAALLPPSLPFPLPSNPRGDLLTRRHRSLPTASSSPLLPGAEEEDTGVSTPTSSHVVGLNKVRGSPLLLPPHLCPDHHHHHHHCHPPPPPPPPPPYHHHHHQQQQQRLVTRSLNLLLPWRQSVGGDLKFGRPGPEKPAPDAPGAENAAADGDDAAAADEQPSSVEDLVWHTTDSAVKPIVGNRRIERVPEPRWEAGHFPSTPS